MTNKPLFTAISISKVPFENGVLKQKKRKKTNFELLKGEKIADTLYHFVYKNDGRQIHSYYFIGDAENMFEKYLFIENNDIYEDFVSLWGGRELGMDVYLDVNSPERIFEQLTHVYNNRFYDENEPLPTCHFFGQQSWHGNAYLIANRTALLELKEAIDVALQHEEIRLGLSPSDGEGYDLFIKCVEDDFEWEDLEMPYHDRESYVPDESVGLPPYKVFKKYKHHLG